MGGLCSLGARALRQREPVLSKAGSQKVSSWLQKEEHRQLPLPHGRCEAGFWRDQFPHLDFQAMGLPRYGIFRLGMSRCK